MEPPVFPLRRARRKVKAWMSRALGALVRVQEHCEETLAVLLELQSMQASVAEAAHHTLVLEMRLARLRLDLEEGAGARLLSGQEAAVRAAASEERDSLLVRTTHYGVVSTEAGGRVLSPGPELWPWLERAWMQRREAALLQCHEVTMAARAEDVLTVLEHRERFWQRTLEEETSAWGAATALFWALRDRQSGLWGAASEAVEGVRKRVEESKTIGAPLQCWFRGKHEDGGLSSAAGSSALTNLADECCARCVFTTRWLSWHGPMADAYAWQAHVAPAWLRLARSCAALLQLSLSAYAERLLQKLRDLNGYGDLQDRLLRSPPRDTPPACLIYSLQEEQD